MFNTIRLLQGKESLTRQEYKKFEKYNTVIGNNSDPVEIAVFTMDEKEKALEDLKKYRCTYKDFGETVDITEYALEYCETNEDGEFVAGSDYDFAEEE